jgi:signal transduction histidine kinase
MKPINILIYEFSGIASLSLGLLVLFKNPKNKVNIYFFLFIFFAFLWLVSLFLFYYLESQKLVLLFGRINFAVVLPMVLYLIEFSLSFPFESSFLSKKIKIFLYIFTLIFSLVCILTPLVDKTEEIIEYGKRKTIYGELYPFYIIYYLLTVSFILYVFFYKLKKTKNKIEKNQILYVLIGLVGALLLGFITQILLPLLKIQEAAHYGPLAILFFSIIISQAILKHYLFEIKVIAVEFLVFILVFFSFFNIFFSINLELRLLNIVIFIGNSIFGIFLIKSVIKEIESRKKTEEIAITVQKAYEDLKKLDMAKSEFISIASHQLRTPLTAVKGYLSMILEGSYGELTEKLKEKIENVYQSNERLIKLVNDLLSISKIETGELKLNFEREDLREIIREVISEISIKAKEKNLYLNFEEPKEFPKVLLDKEKIRQVILNLIDNAIKYTQEGGITVKLLTKENKLQIIISDTGEGLTKEEKEKIFERFSRGMAGTKFWAEGAGLGLYIAKRFVEMHNGKIWVESEGIGKGSTFYVELPMK